MSQRKQKKMMKEIIYFNGQEISIDKLKSIILRYFKDNNMLNSEISNAVISSLEEKHSIFRMNYHINSADLGKLIPLFENLSSNILEYEIQLLETYLDMHKIKNEFYVEMVKFTQIDSIGHFTYGMKSEKSILRNILLRANLINVIDKCFYWSNTKQGGRFWFEHHVQFGDWLEEQNVDEQIYH